MSARTLFRSWPTGWGWFFLLYGFGVAIALGLTGWLGGMDVVGQVAGIGVPPLFAALLAWGLSESTRRHEQNRQERLRQDDLDRLDRHTFRDLRRESFLQVQQHLQNIIRLGMDVGRFQYDLYMSGLDTGDMKIPQLKEYIQAVAQIDQYLFQTSDIAVLEAVGELIDLLDQYATGVKLRRRDPVPTYVPPADVMGKVLPAYTEVQRLLAQSVLDLYAPTTPTPTAACTA